MMPAREAYRSTGMLPEYRIALFLAMLYTRHGFSKTGHACIGWESHDMSFGKKRLETNVSGNPQQLLHHTGIMTYRF